MSPRKPLTMDLRTLVMVQFLLYSYFLLKSVDPRNSAFISLIDKFEPKASENLSLTLG